MVKKSELNIMGQDALTPLADFYDDIMQHVDYERWIHITTTLGAMLPAPFRYLDAGCGTGVLLKELATDNWDSVGMDLSPAMLYVARQHRKLPRLVQGNFCTLPFRSSFNLVTCLFDSLNFLLSEEVFTEAIQSFYEVLLPNGLFYFDIVTEKMITNHFENTSRTEEHGQFSSTWNTSYAHETQTCETRIRIDSGTESISREHIFSTEFVLQTLEDAGFSLLALRDGNTWRKPTKNTTRIDFIVVKGDTELYRKKLQDADDSIEDWYGILE
ncbi:MAG: methyltransferase domain-containing protein [Candidatus Hydrogenedentes bacterium]|nr:methyltransferase domain-containing protein [Candidatus Hydrogenedentota bacterium]